MAGRTTWYHPVHARSGQAFEDDLDAAARSKDGWVDNSAKIGVNRWGPDEAAAVERKHRKYLSGEEPGIDDGRSVNHDRPGCAIWRTVATGVPSPGLPLIDSPRTDGTYAISVQAARSLLQADDRLWARLTTWLVDQRQAGSVCPEVSAAAVEEARRAPDMSVHQRADRLLRHVDSRTQRIGQVLLFADQQSFCAALAWSESSTADEVRFLFDYLVERAWLERMEDVFGGYKVSVAGHARLAELAQPVIATSQAFVAMWFHETMDDAWERGIRPGIEDAGYRPVRIDRTEHNDKIDDAIIAQIRRSRFVVADFTQGDSGARGGVYYEAGFAHGLDRPVIFACRKDQLENAHFDTRQYNHIVWETPEVLRSRLAERILATIGDGPISTGGTRIRGQTP